MAIQIPHNPLIQSVPMAEYANQFAQLKGNQQQNTLRQMQIDQAPQQLARQQRLDEQSASLNQANIDEKNTKGMAQKHAMAKQMATFLYNEGIKSGLPEGSQELQQLLEQKGGGLRPILAKAFDNPEMLTKPMDWNALKSLAQGPDLSGSDAGGYHPPTATNQGVLQYGPNGWEPIKIGGKLAMPVGADVGLQGSIAGAKSANEYVVIDGRAYQKGDISAGGMPSAPQQPQPQVSTDFHQYPKEVDQSQFGTVEATPQEVQDYGYKIGGQPVVQPQRNMPMTPEQKAQLETETKANQEQNKADIENSQKMAQEQAKYKQQLPKTINNIERNIALVDKALNHKGLSGAVGMRAGFDYIPGTAEKDFSVLADQLGGNAFLSAFESLKGGGAITEVEGKKATDAVARLNRAQSEPAYKEALNDLKTSLIELKKTMREQAGQKIDEQIKPSFNGPKSGDVEDGYRFKGGDKADPNNWEKI